MWATEIWPNLDDETFFLKTYFMKFNEKNGYKIKSDIILLSLIWSISFLARR